MHTINRRVEARITNAIFGEPIIGNTLRGLVVEGMIAEALEPKGWNWVGADFSSWDFEHGKTWATIEIKQSAALQPWSAQYSHPPRPRFDIAYRSGYWYQEEGSESIEWHEERCRPADLFIFAWHGMVDGEVDQRDVAQWKFFPVCTEALPEVGGSIGLERLKALAMPCAWQDLQTRVTIEAAKVVPRQRINSSALAKPIASN